MYSQPRRVLSNSRRPSSAPPVVTPGAQGGQAYHYGPGPMVPLKSMGRKKSEFPVFSLVALGFLMACGWLALSADSLREYLAAHRQRDMQLEKVATLRSEISTLRARYESARNNGLETQAQIRERLDMRRPGERIIYIQRPGPKPIREAEALNEPLLPTQTITPPTGPVSDEPMGLPSPPSQSVNRAPVQAPEVQAPSDEPVGLPSPGTLGTPRR